MSELLIGVVSARARFDNPLGRVNHLLPSHWPVKLSGARSCSGPPVSWEAWAALAIVVAVLYALALTIFVYRSLTWDQFVRAASKAVKTTGVVLLLIGISATFGYLISFYGVAEKTGQLMASISTEPWAIFLMVNIILFVLGTFLDMAATILICTPIFLPICMQYGMGPVQFGMVLLLNCALGLNTPPVGTTQFVGCAIGGVSVGTVMRTIWPFYGALLAALALVTYVPAFSLWLPGVLLN